MIFILLLLLYRDNQSIAELLRESEDIAQRREEYEKLRDVLNHSMEILNEVRDYNIHK